MVHVDIYYSLENAGKITHFKTLWQPSETLVFTGRQQLRFELSWFSWSKLQTNKKIMASQCWADFSSRVIDSHDWQINVLLKHDWKTDKLQMNEHRNTVNNNHNKQGKLHSLKDCSLRNVCTVENREWTWVNVTFWNRVSKKLNWHCKTKEKTMSHQRIRSKSVR